MMKKSVLLVDDSASLRQVASITLNRAGFETVQAQDGVDALAKLDGRRFHLIITDINMPRMSGLELLKAIKASPSYRFTPVLMLTTENGQDKMAEAKAQGARAWLTKPFDPSRLLEAIGSLLRA